LPASAIDRLPPALIVHDAADIARALAPARPVTLLSPPGFALHAGCLWWQSLLAAARFDGPALLDCADAPGRALEALRIGLRDLVLDPATPAFPRIAALADESGATLLAAPPPALDLAAEIAPAALAAWLDAVKNPA
jgi:hypothetical protein